MNAAGAAAPTMRQIEDAALAVHRHVRQATDLARAGDYRTAHAAAEAAQGAARKLKEMLGSVPAEASPLRGRNRHDTATRPVMHDRAGDPFSPAGPALRRRHET